MFLKILIGTSDSILRIDAPSSLVPLQQRLCSQIQKVLFELWLLSRTQNPLLWEALQNRIQGWTRHMPLIHAWKVVTFALTKKTVSILYGNTNANESVVVKFDDSVQQIQLDDKYVFYAWHRILNLTGNPNETIDQPPNLIAFMNGVEVIVNQFLKIGFSIDKNSTGILIPPTGNTILNIFGSWLFDCILLNRPGFEEGTALAMKILSNIMITTHKTDFLPVYISSYFSCLQRALSTEGRVLVSAITSSTNIFTKEIKGVRCLVPLFFSAIQKVLSGRIKSVENVMPSEHFRKACLQIFSTIICLPNHLGTTKFATKSLSGIEVPDYHSLKAHFSTLLTEALTKETNLSNTELLLNLSYIWCIEDIDNNCDFARQIIGLIIRKITQNRWTPDIIIPAFNVLILMSQLYHKIDKGYEQANLIVDQLCRIIINIGNPPSNNMEKISCLAFKCVSSWIMTDQWLLQFKETRVSLLTAIVTALTGKPSGSNSNSNDSSETIINTPGLNNSTNSSSSSSSSSSSKKKDKKKNKEEKNALASSQPSKSELKSLASELNNQSVFIKEAAQNTLMTILNHLGNFPTLSGASVLSTLAIEDDILQEIIDGSNGQITNHQTKEFMRYYITDDRVLLCLIDRPYHPSGHPQVCIIVRDKTGRYAWDSSLTYLSTSNHDENQPQLPIYHEENIPITGIPFQASSVKPMDVNELSNVLNYLSSTATNSAFKNVQFQVQKEFTSLKRNNFKLSQDISTKIPKPADTYASDCKFQQSRMFLSHIGYLSLENRSKLFPITMNSSFYEALRQLDEKAERITINVGVLFGNKNQGEDEWFGNEGGSLDYQEFISTLGWGVNLSSHRGHKGILEDTGCNVAPYWSDYSTEIIFQVTTLIPNRNDIPDHSHKRKAALHCSTLVMWLEDFGSFQSQWIWKHVRYNIIIIVIVPLEFGLYSVRIFSKNDSYCIGPICDACVLSKSALGHVVRDTCIMAWHKENANKPSSTHARIECIDRIFDLHKKNCNLEQFYSNQFSVLDQGDQISPLELDRARNTTVRINAPAGSLKKSLHTTNNTTTPVKQSSLVRPPPRQKLKRNNTDNLSNNNNNITTTNTVSQPQHQLQPPITSTRPPTNLSRGATDPEMNSYQNNNNDDYSKQQQVVKPPTRAVPPNRPAPPSRPAPASPQRPPPSRGVPPSQRGGLANPAMRGAPPGIPGTKRPPPPARAQSSQSPNRIRGNVPSPQQSPTTPPSPSSPSNSDSGNSWVGGSRTTRPSQGAGQRGRPPPKLFGTQRRQSPNPGGS